MSPALVSELGELARFSAGGEGVTRLAWSAELFAAYDWLAARAREAGLSSRTDAAGNLHLDSQPRSGPRVMVGSHLDTVPHGGRFDGALGVLGGLEAVRILQREGACLPFPTCVTAFMDEEGTRFGTALFGSRAFIGDDVAVDGGRKDAEGISLREAMAARGYAIDDVRRAEDVDALEAYLELHIEQGPVLDDQGSEIGIVTSIVGLLGLSVELAGEANHAGTTPMNRRRDALVGAARIIDELREFARATPGVTSNVGTISVQPGGKNVVPGLCTFSVDVRAATPEGFAKLDEEVLGIVGRVAREEKLGLEVIELYRLEPVVMDVGLRDLLERAADLAGASHLRLASGAGHDAMAVGRHVPSAMLFVPSRGGLSHSPDEQTSTEHCALGAETLAQVLKLLGAAA